MIEPAGDSASPSPGALPDRSTASVKAAGTPGAGSWWRDPRFDLFSLSDGAARLHGLPAGGAPCSFDAFASHLEPGDREALRRSLDDAACSSEPLVVEYRVREGDGATRWLLSTISVTAGEQRAARAHGVTIDLTERRLAAARAHRGEAWLRFMLGQSDDAILVLDRLGRLRFASPAAERVLGRPPGELTGTMLESLVRPEDQLSLARLLARAATAAVLAVACGI
jgi:PAS domain-containing protein